MQAKIDTIKDKFSFVEDSKNAWQEVNGLIQDGDPKIPKITIDFSKAESEKYNYGGKALVLDMTWYERYKPFCDGIIIGFAYLGFIFLVFKRLPDIISGSGAITEKSDDVQRGFRTKGGK